MSRPFLLRHLEAVFIHERHHADPRVGEPELLKITVDLGRQILHLPGLFRVDLLDCPARGNQMDGQARSVPACKRPPR